MMVYSMECQNVSKKYRNTLVPALTGLQLSLPKGKIIGLLGPNGSGKTTLIKLACGLLTPDSGKILIGGQEPGVATKAQVSYLPDKEALPSWMKVTDLMEFFGDFYQDFQPEAAMDMLQRLQIEPSMKLKTMSKGTREKVQLILVMSRKADLYILDEPIAGVDPAARDYILETIISNYREDSTVLISTHLIADIEKILDEVVFLKNGALALHESVDALREEHGKSVDALFREVYKC